MEDKHAYLIMTHNDFESLKYLLRAIDDQRNDIYICVDKKTAYVDFDEIRKWAKEAGIFFLPQMNVVWGHLSVVECEIKLLEHATENGPYKYYHLLSGNDFPLKSQNEIHNYFSSTDREYVNCHFDGNDDSFLDNIRFYYPFGRWIGDPGLELSGKRGKLRGLLIAIQDKLIKIQRKLSVNRTKDHQNTIFVKGDEFFSITDELAKYVIANKNEIRKRFRWTYKPDEFMLSTVVYNSDLKNKIALSDGEEFFARKISVGNSPLFIKGLLDTFETADKADINDEPLVSIVVPIYNVEAYLEECLSSITAQTYRKLQVILVDDGSKDDSGTLAKDYAAKDPRFMYVKRANGGLSAARNTGIENATGDYIAFVDSDDWIEPDYIEVMLTTARRTDADLTICGYTKEEDVPKVVCFDKQVLFSRSSAMSVLGNIYTSDYMMMILAWNKLYKRSIFANIRYPEGRIHEDEFTIHRAIDSADIVSTVPGSLYHYRIRTDSITGSENTANMKHFDIIDAHRDRVKCCRKMIYSDFYRLIVYSLFEEIICLMLTYDNDSFDKYRLNRKFRHIMLLEYIRHYSQLDKKQKKTYLAVILNPKFYINHKRRVDAAKRNKV